MLRIFISNEKASAILTPFLFLLFFANAALAADTPTEIESETHLPGYYLDTLDVDIDGGFGSLHSQKNYGGRLRVGKLWAREVRFYSLGATVGDYSVMGFNGGLEFEAMHLETGLWAQGGLLYSELGPAVKISAGWACFGADLFYIKEKESSAIAFMGKVRIPLRLIFLAL